MNFPPYQWRADGGYRPPPNLPIPPLLMYYYTSGPVMVQPPGPAPGCLPMPLPIAAVYAAQQQVHYVYPPASKSALISPPQPSVATAKGSAKKEDADVKTVKSANKNDAKDDTSTKASAKETAKKDDASVKSRRSADKSDAKAAAEDAKDDTSNKSTAAKDKSPPSNPLAPPSIRVGTNYMFPVEHTRVHILAKAARVWEKKYEGARFRFHIFKVSTGMSVREVIQNTMKLKVQGDWEKCKGWAVTEVIERGDGKWDKGTTIEYTSEKAERTLANMGWTSKRGDTLPPLWITVHLVEASK